MSIQIQKHLTAEERITREGGEKLRKKILEHFQTKTTPLTLDFDHKPIASISFWDEAIAKLLLEGWSKEDVGKKLVFKGLHPRDETLMKDLVRSRGQ